MIKNIFLIFSAFIMLSGCQKSLEVDQAESVDIYHQTTNTLADNQQNQIEILRYKVSAETPVFLSGRTQGYLSNENNCLIIKQQDHIYALALPISDDDSQWQTKWDDANQVLVFEGSTYPLGSYLDLGGGGMGHEQVISNTSACQKFGVFGAFNLTVE